MSSQIPLNSKDDIVAELILVTKHNLIPCSKYNEDYVCEICFDSLLDQYVLTYPCDSYHVFHRNCLLTYVLNYKKVLCPICKKYP